MINEGMLIGDRYEILGRIGSGGMADVYKARDNKLNRLVAVKVLRQEFRQDKTFVAKFQKEAQAAAGLSHPNIVSVYDVGEDTNANFIVMELVEGITLKDYIRRKKKLSIKEATSIAIQVSLGLEAAHKQGLVHRDVKPQNIMISTDGKVKLSDFGIARAASSNTISSNVMGSVHYSSPEQVRGGFANAQSDIYSLGITLYEMVTGHLPFDGDTSVAIAIKHLQEEIIPPNKYTPDLPYSLNQIILKCTQKSVDRRYECMADLIMDLKRSLVDPNGNFVALAPLSSHAQTIMLSKDELAAIQAAAGTPTETVSSHDDDEDEEDERPRRRRQRYEEEEEEEDDEEESGGIGGALEKILTIGGFLIGAAIIVILIIFLGRAAGFFGGSKASSAAGSAVQSTHSVVADGQVEVPNIVGMTVSEAQDALNKVQLGIAKDGETASDTVKEGVIISQDIEAGTKVDAHSTVKYVISTGVADIEVPDVTGKSQSVAESTLKASGLETKVTQENSDKVEIGNVIRTNPEAGSKVSTGSTVEIVVSLGKKDSKVEVPNVLGVAENTAKTTLSSLSLVVVVETGTSDKYKEGQVMAQSVAAGTKVAQKTEITITVSSGSASSTDNPTDPDADEEAASGDETAASSTASSTTSSTASSAAEEATGKWSCNQRLDTPPNYNGGAIKLTLSQVVDGKTKESTIMEVEKPEFPLALNTEGASGVSVGTVYVYEKIDGEYKKIAKYTVPFEAEQ